MHKNTLYITFDGLSDPLGQSQILPYLCGIASANIHIHILSCEKQDRLEKEKQNILSLIKDLPIQWDYILYDESGGMLSRLGYIRKIKTLAGRIRKEKHVRLVHCRSYLASLIGLHFKKRYNIPFIFDMRGFWADERLDGGIWKKNNIIERFFYSYFKRKETEFLLRAEAIVSLTNAAVKVLSDTYPDNLIRNKTTVIPCCADMQVFNPASVHTPAQAPDLKPGDHLLIYTGSIGTWYYTKELIDCMLCWKESIPELKLLFLTKDQAALERILATYPSEKINFIRSASSSHKEVASYLLLAKAAVFFIKPSYSKIASSPTKMAECWAMDLPIITNAGIGDNDLYFNTYKGGILLQAFNQQEYTRACQEYLNMARTNGTFRKIALDHFDIKTAIEKYKGIYDALITEA